MLWYTLEYLLIIQSGVLVDNTKPGNFPKFWTRELPVHSSHFIKLVLYYYLITIKLFTIIIDLFSEYHYIQTPMQELHRFFWLHDIEKQNWDSSPLSSNFIPNFLITVPKGFMWLSERFGAKRNTVEYNNLTAIHLRND